MQMGITLFIIIISFANLLCQKCEYNTVTVNLI